MWCGSRTIAIAFGIVLGLSAGGASELNMPHARSPLRLQIDLPKEIQTGRTLLLKLRVKNVSNRTIEQPLGGRPSYDFIVSKRNGMVIWRWQHGQVVQDILELRTMTPGAELAFTGEWDQRDNAGKVVPPGIYLVRAVLNTDPPKKLQTKAKRLTIKP